MECIVLENLSGLRLDKYLSEAFEELSRSRAQKLIEAGAVCVNGEKALTTKRPVETGDRVLVELPEPEESAVLPADIPLDIVYEDEAVLIVNKPKGLVVHPAPGHTNDTLVNALLFHVPQLSGINGVARPGIVHRIDRDTTGLLVVCKTDAAHQSLAKQLEEHSITRKYYAIVVGNLKEDGTVDAPIGRHPTDRKKMSVHAKNGRRAVTHYHVLEHLQNGRYTLIECRLETGRTHQIRVHMASLHHPLLGDTIYGSERQPYQTQGQVLHAGVLGFVHPSTGVYMEFQAPLPDYFERLLEKLRG
ncbi:MAG: RluA family pseudouridine synthase [Lachnospiraceae bacterium]|nr:RluA family pseudouridine synthase [Lachnospiraceae bacterium]